MVSRLAYVFVGAIIIWLVLRVVRKRLFTKIKDNDHRYKARKFSSFLAFTLVLVLLAIVYSDKLGGFTVALGVAGAGVAFALQELIASFAGWLTIIFGGFYKTSDRVELGGIRGDVMDIGILRTTIMETGEWVDGDLYNGRIVLVANSFVFKAPVFNYSGDFPFLWDEIKIPIQFGSNYEKTQEIIESVLTREAVDVSGISKQKWKELQTFYRLEDARTEPIVSLVVNDNWVEFTGRYVVNYKKRRLTKSLIFTKLLTAIEATNGEIMFASATFQLVDPPKFDVNVSKN